MSRIDDPSLAWKDGNIPFSTEFDDIYYKHDGIDETNGVFLGGNNLPQAWIGQRQFTIAETGFGSGLNFLCAWKSFEETTQSGERLDFISVERFPLSPDDLAKSVTRLTPVFGQERIDRFLAVYPPRFPGFHRRHITDRITLTLIFDDALRAFKQLTAPVDAWFLDGFSPSKNETLWHPDLFKEMARLSHNRTTLATFTAAGAVKDGLTQAGFAIQRVKGWGYKKHRLNATYPHGSQKPAVTPPERVRIIGAGLAGAGAAYALRRRGIAVKIVDAATGPAQGASGNRLGLINPKIEAQDNPRTDAGLAAFSFAQHVLGDLPDIDHVRSGALHLGVDPEKTERLKKLSENSSWLSPHMRWITAAHTKEVCGHSLPFDGLYYADAATVDPRKTVAALSNGINMRWKASYVPDAQIPTILACGWGLHETSLGRHLPLQPVRGQTTYITAPFPLACPVMFGSYAAPLRGGEWALGATFEQNQSDPVLQESARAKNISTAAKIFGLDLSKQEITSEWAQIRTASRDRFPIVGRVDENLYVSGALGSHGIQFGLLLGEILACAMTNAPLPLGKDALKALSVDRFIERNST